MLGRRLSRLGGCNGARHSLLIASRHSSSSTWRGFSSSRRRFPELRRGSWVPSGILVGSAMATTAALIGYSGCQAEAADEKMASKSQPCVEDDYDIGVQLGSGHFATVHRGRCKRTGVEVAIKIVPKSNQTAASIRHEAEVLKRVSMHKRIASLEALYETASAFYIVMECAPTTLPVTLPTTAQLSHTYSTHECAAVATLHPFCFECTWPPRGLRCGWRRTL